MTDLGYSDPIDHAFAFAAKYAPTSSTGAQRIHRQANIAVTLARFGCDEPTIVGGILLPILEDAAQDQRGLLEDKIIEKFGPVVYVCVRDAAEPRYDPQGRRRPWRTAKQEYLARLTEAETRALDVVSVREIHWCGTALTAVRRLGPEYLPTPPEVSRADLAWWYQSLTAVLAARTDWHRRPLLDQILHTSEAVIRSIREA